MARIDLNKFPPEYVSNIMAAKRVFYDVKETGKWVRPEDLKTVNILKQKGYLTMNVNSNKLFKPTKKGNRVFSLI